VLHRRLLPEANQVLGSAPSRPIDAKPKKSRIINRFFKTLKAELIYGRIFQNIKAVRTAVRDFIARYNAKWLIEKTGYFSQQPLGPEVEN